jgi:GlpG protein
MLEATATARLAFPLFSANLDRFKINCRTTAVAMLPVSDINFRRTPVTLIIAALAVALEIVCNLDPERRQFYYQGLRLGILSTLWSGQFWQPLTTTLLHGNLLHALFNVSWLFIFGQVLEPRVGSFRYLGLFVLLAYVSMLPEFVIQNYSAPIDAQVGCLGLSGIMYGMFGMLWIGRRWQPDFRAVCDQQTVQLMLVWLMVCVILTYTNVMPVANFAHGAGLLFGVLYGLTAFAPRRRMVWGLLATVATLLVLSTMIAVPGHAGYEYSRRHRQIQRILNQIERPPAEPPSDATP